MVFGEPAFLVRKVSEWRVPAFRQETESLGYSKFVAQGGDWGAVISELMGVQAPPELLGIHTNMANVIPLDIDKLVFSGAPAPANLSADEKLAYDRLSTVYAKGIGYAYQMGLRPQTLYGIADSPVGLAAYFLDHDAHSYEMIARVFAGGTEGYPDQEGVVPLIPVPSGPFQSALTYDDTNGLITAVAIVNPSPATVVCTIIAYDANGTALPPMSLPLAPYQQTATQLRSLLPSIVGKVGLVTFQNAVVLGLRFDGTALTSIPTSIF